jgi:hypothetical protein
LAPSEKTSRSTATGVSDFIDSLSRFSSQLTFSTTLDGSSSFRRDGDAGWHHFRGVWLTLTCILLGSAVFRRFDFKNGDGLSAVEFESASVRTDAHQQTTRHVRASLVRRTRLRPGCASTDRQDAIGRDATPRPPSTHLRSVSMNRPATTRRRPQPAISEQPGWRRQCRRQESGNSMLNGWNRCN